MHSSKEIFLKICEKPNEIKTVNESEILIYYFDTICESGEIVLDSDKCYASFYFKNGKLDSTDFTCE